MKQAKYKAVPDASVAEKPSVQMIKGVPHKFFTELRSLRDVFQAKQSELELLQPKKAQTYGTCA